MFLEGCGECHVEASRGANEQAEEEIGDSQHYAEEVGVGVERIFYQAPVPVD